MLNKTRLYRLFPGIKAEKKKMNGKTEKRMIPWPPLGQRIIKTSLAVTLCLFFYLWRGYRGESMPAEAAITAIICMQSCVHDTRTSALNRLAGTMIGAMCGFVFLLLMLL